MERKKVSMGDVFVGLLLRGTIDKDLNVHGSVVDEERVFCFTSIWKDEAEAVDWALREFKGTKLHIEPRKIFMSEGRRVVAFCLESDARYFVVFAVYMSEDRSVFALSSKSLSPYGLFYVNLVVISLPKSEYVVEPHIEEAKKYLEWLEALEVL